MRTYVLASLRAHSRRYVAVALAVLIATAFMVATNALGTAAEDGWHESIATEYERADVVVSDGSRGAADKITGTDGVEAVSANWSTFENVTTGDLDTVASIGTIAADQGMRWQEILDGDFPDRANEAVVSEDRASDAGVGIGDTLVIDNGTDRRTFEIAGIVEPSTGQLGSSFYLPEKVMGQLAAGGPSEVLVATDDAADASLQAVRSEAPSATVQSVDAYVHELQLDATGDIDVMRQMLFVFVSIALIVAGLVIANTLSMVLAQRSRDLALLRCVGALRRQTVRAVFYETLTVAVLASLTGVAAGWGLAYAGVAAVTAFEPNLPFATPRLTVLGTGVPVAVSVAVALAAAVLPARRLNRLAPLAALRPEAAVTAHGRPNVLRLVGAATALLVGFGALTFAAVTGALAIGMVGGGVSFVGVLLLGPVLVPALITGLRPIVGRLGVPGRLALANAVRNRRRTAATSSALLIGVTLISTVVVGTASMKSSTATEMDSRAPVDMVLESDQRLGGGTAQQVAAIDGVRDVASLAGTSADTGREGRGMSVVGIDDDAASIARPESDLRRITDDEIFMPSAAAQKRGLATGDRIRVTGDSGAVSLRVVVDEGWGSSAAVSGATLADLDNLPTTRAVWLRAGDDADVATIVGELNALAQATDGEIDGSLPQRESVMTAMDVVLAVTVGLLGIAVLIAIVGVGNTLSLAVLERVPENSLLRAMGLRRGQQRSMLAVEALLIATVAGVLGIALGCTYALFGIRTLAAEEFATTSTIDVPAGQLAVVLVAAAIAGLLACVLPARRAATIPPAQGLAVD